MEQNKFILLSSPKEGSVVYSTLLKDTSTIIDQAQKYAYRTVNAFLTIRNWFIGERVDRELLGGKDRATYGERLILNLAESLTQMHGKGFDYSSLSKYIKFYRLFPTIVDTVSPQFTKSSSEDSMGAKFQLADLQKRPLLPWTHYRELIRIEDKAARDWYEQEALREGWSVRTLHRNIGSQYYYRLLQSSNKMPVMEEMRKITSEPQMGPTCFMKNPLVAEFLGFTSNISFTESKMETAIIDHLQNFVMELGKGYAFVARQQRIRTDMGDFYIDLVFYNYILKCFLLVDLKNSQISHQDVGQMDMYVRMYDKLKRSEGDNPTIGLILCADTSADIARYSVLNGNERLFQAKYLTYLPTEEELRCEIERQKEIFMLQQSNPTS